MPNDSKEQANVCEPEISRSLLCRFCWLLLDRFTVKIVSRKLCLPRKETHKPRAMGADS